MISLRVAGAQRDSWEGLLDVASIHPDGWTIRGWATDLPSLGRSLPSIPFPSFDADAMLRKWNLWGYIDARDGAQSIERALEVAPAGFDNFIIAAADTVMSRPNAELVAEVFPETPIRGDLGEHDTMLGIDKARRLLGFDPQHSWRDEV